MSTDIRIRVDGLNRLKEQAKSVAQVNRESAKSRLDERATTVAAAQVQARSRLYRGEDPDRPTESELDKRLAQSNSISVASELPLSGQQKPNGVPSVDFVRELSAQRGGPLLIPFGLSWRGNLTTRQPTTFEILLTKKDGTAAIRPSVFTYSGGDYLAPGPFQIAASGSKVDVAQPPRYSEWKTVGRISLNNITQATWTFEGFWADELINPVYTDWPESFDLTSAPGNNSPVGVLSHASGPTNLSVGSDGSIYFVLKLPLENVDALAAELPDDSFTFPPSSFRDDVRPIWWGSVSSSSPLFLGGLQQYVDVAGVKGYSSYTLGAESPGTSRPLYDFAYKEPYMFARVKNGEIESKIAYYNKYSYNPYNVETNFGEFILNNSFPDDPGRQMRTTYGGEVRIKGNDAHFLRMRYVEEFEGELYVWYEDFPFSSLTAFIIGTGKSARLIKGVTFEDHIYKGDGTPWTAAKLAEIVNPTSYQDQPEFLPDRVVKLKVPSSFVAKAAARLSTEGEDELTPLTYFVAMP